MLGDFNFRIGQYRMDSDIIYGIGVLEILQAQERGWQWGWKPWRKVLASLQSQAITSLVRTSCPICTMELVIIPSWPPSWAVMQSWYM